MKILVVDDEPLIRLGLAFEVGEWGYEVLEAADADQAIALLEQHPDIRLVITDVDMPGSMDGIRLAHFVRSRWPPIALIVISGKLTDAEPKLPAGSRFFEKPYPEQQLRQALAELTA
ncbi:response regulator [Devosia sp.]|uniref:response regulator n=1 Tax=Devosia sp. TaxID=1871048 RepID=UPI001AC850F5|nr:response regulator [Devosia sp.]MBN9309862.1 response regulator [Devosia sp.]